MERHVLQYVYIQSFNLLNMSKKDFINLLKAIEKEFQDKENECFEQILYMQEHNFNMEEEALRYKQKAYNDAWLTISRYINKVD